MSQRFLGSLNNGFGPVFNDREPRRIVLVGAILIASLFLYRHDDDAQVFYGFVVSSVLFGQILKRCFLFCEEYFHVNTRHKGSLKQAFKKCLVLENVNKVTVLVTFSITTTLLYKEETYKIMNFKYLVIALFSSFTPYALGLAFSGKIDAPDVMKWYYVAEGQAWGYFTGYLKILLPHWDAYLEVSFSKPDMKDETNTMYGDLMSDKRMFVVIPKDGYCYKKLEKVDPNIREVTTTPSYKVSRAGVMERQYRNTIHRIDRGADKDPLYIFLEYATPLLNMYEMVKSQNIKLTVEEKEEQITEFYRTLKTLIENDETCRGKVVLVLTGPMENGCGTGRSLGDILSDIVESTVL